MKILARQWQTPQLIILTRKMKDYALMSVIVSCKSGNPNLETGPSSYHIDCWGPGPCAECSTISSS